MEGYFDEKKELYKAILEFFENLDEYSDEISKNYIEEISEITNKQKIEGDREEMEHFLLTIKSISDNHHRNKYFNEKINQILKNYKEEIKQTFSYDEIYHIFENNKMIILCMLKNEIMSVTESIYDEMISKIEPNGNSYCHFFYPELENFIGCEKIKEVKEEIITKFPTFFEELEEKRQEGENESYICSLIRQDLVEEFIVYLNRYNYSVSSQIVPSIFETNTFLTNKKNITLIEYSAFYGSIQIFRYLYMNKAVITPSIWLYAIHSKNAELIHLIESIEISPSKNEYVLYLIESLKCHHNDIANYIENNFLDQNENDSEQKENILSNIMEYHNYDYFHTDAILDHGFFYLLFFNYKKLFELLLKTKEKEIQIEIIQ